MNHLAHEERKGGFFSSRWSVGLMALLAVAGLYLLAEHQMHVFGYLPLLLLLACPLMHFLMHGHRHSHQRDPSADQPPHRS